MVQLNMGFICFHNPIIEHKLVSPLSLTVYLSFFLFKQTECHRSPDIRLPLASVVRQTYVHLQMTAISLSTACTKNQPDGDNTVVLTSVWSVLWRPTKIMKVVARSCTSGWWRLIQMHVTCSHSHYSRLRWFGAAFTCCLLLRED